MSEHAFFPPSGASAWVHCGLWSTMNERFPQPDTEHTVEGREAHGMLEAATRDGDVSGGDEEMKRGAVTFANFVRSFGIEGVFEYRLPPGSFGPNNWGTPDWFGWSSWDRLDVVDYKYGHGFVDAFGNWQLINYLRLILDAYRVDGAWEQKLTVGLHIVQPRNYERPDPIRSWVVPASDLRAWWNQLSMAIERPRTLAVVGEHCEHCPGRAHCPALQRAAGKYSDRAMHATPFELSLPDAGAELRYLQTARDVIDARVSGLVDEITKASERGQHTPGYVLERKGGRRVWNISPEQVQDLGRMYRKNLTKPLEVVTPRQAELAGVPKEVIDCFSERKSGSPELVRAEKSQVRKIFGANKHEQ